jgi:hypothetical protein
MFFFRSHFDTLKYSYLVVFLILSCFRFTFPLPQISRPAL